jgi:hypothetical protein
VTAATSATASSGSSDAPSDSEHTSETAAKLPSPTEPEGHDDMDTAEPDDSMGPGKSKPWLI